MNDVMRSLSRNLITLLLAIVGFSVPQAGTSFASHDFSVPDVTADESAGSAKIVISPSCPVDKIEYRTEDGTAREGADYTSVSGTLTSPPFEFEIPILDDSILEENETVRVIVSKFTFPGAAVCVGAQRVEATLTIQDDDSSPAAVGRERSAPTSRSKAAVAPAGQSGASRAPAGGSTEPKSPTDRYATDLSKSETLTTNSQSTDGSIVDVVPAPPRTRAEGKSDRRFLAAQAFGAFALVSALALWLIWRRRFAR